MQEYMQNLKPRFVSFKYPIFAMAVALTIPYAIGCNADEKPSKMVEMRAKMEEQKNKMKASNPGSAPGAPPVVHSHQ